jgi:hypothetical protein
MPRRSASTPIPRLRWPLAGVAAAAPLLGCGPGDVDQDFRVTSIAFDGEATLTLTFSQPIANADAINPNDFRISFGRTFELTDPESGATERNTFYSDIGAFGDYDYYGPQRFAFAAASAGGSANQLVLDDPDGAIAQACVYVSYYLEYYEQYPYEGAKRDMGLFLHYAAGDIPLESESGEPLADVAPDWVLSEQGYLANYDYGFIHLVPKLRIPCP